MNYYIFTYTKPTNIQCHECVKKHAFLVSKINYMHKENIEKFNIKCTSTSIDYLHNIFVKNSKKIITKQPMCFCLDAYRVDDLIYKLIL